MKNKLNAIAYLFTLLFAPLTQQVHANTCDSLCVTLIANDTMSNSINVSVNYSGTGFINYPYVHQILDQSNNVIATGNMFFFGQVGGTTVDYPATSANTNWNNFVGTVVFIFDNDTCYLPYPCSNANAIDCSSFCATSIFNDSTTSGLVWISIAFQDSGFINYPYVAQVLDATNNVVATGSMTFFGQIGNTTQDYPVSSNNTNWNNFIGTIVFVYDNDTCYLPYPCTLMNIQEAEPIPALQIAPNPANDFINVQSPVTMQSATVEIYTTDGKHVLSQSNLQGNNWQISTTNLEPGCYFLLTTDEGITYPASRFIITD
jgi:hypothetical protein